MITHLGCARRQVQALGAQRVSQVIADIDVASLALVHLSWQRCRLLDARNSLRSSG